MSDTATALVELVANCWDGYATRVDIQWPSRGSRRKLSISDNGHGMTRGSSSYVGARSTTTGSPYQGDRPQPPAEKTTLAPRSVYGRNGRGRLAGSVLGTL